MSEVRFISARLDALMKQRGFSDYTLADKTGISKTMIYYLRKGQRKTASVEFIAKLADALGTNTQYFIDENADDLPIQKKMSALVADIASTAEELPPSAQRQLREISKALYTVDETKNLDAIYGELLDLITRLTELQGGEQLLAELLDHIKGLTPGLPSAPVTDTPTRRTRATKTKPAKKKAQSSE